MKGTKSSSEKSSSENSFTPLISEYFTLYEKYKEKYDKPCVLMECGDFFEVYASADLSRGNAAEISQVLSSAMPRRSKSANSPFMTGFPSYALKEKMAILLKHGYTVVVVEQIRQDERDKSWERAVTQVVSRGTDLDVNVITNNILSIYAERYGDYWSFGVATCDVGLSDEVIVHDLYSKGSDKRVSMDGLIKFTKGLNPVEVVICAADPAIPVMLKKALGFGDDCRTYTVPFPFVRWVMSVDEMSQHSAEVQKATNALLLYLDEHNIDTQRFSLRAYLPESFLDLSGTASEQLELKMLLRVIDFTKTAMGKRHLRDRVFNPYVDSALLIQEYEAIDCCLRQEDLLERLRRDLRSCPDLDRLAHRMDLGKLSNAEWCKIHEVLQSFVGIVQSINEHGDRTMCRDAHELATAAEAMMQEMQKAVDITFSAGANALKFREGHCQHLDELYRQRANEQAVVFKHENMVKRVVSNISSDIPTKNDVGFLLTSLRAKAVQKAQKVAGWTVVESGAANKSILTSKDLASALTNMKQLSDEIDAATLDLFRKLQRDFYGRWKQPMHQIATAIARIDFLQSACAAQRKYHLVRPQIVPDRHLSVCDLRHLTVETLQQERAFVGNDLLLDSTTGPVVLTVYGINACGKTTFVKSVGLAIIMAQAGLFVPAEGMRFKPFRRIMTRLSGQDNMLRGQSSFVVEMEDLLSIVRRADEDTLVLGDEICRGTEVQSASAIVYSILVGLAERKSFVISATHLHEIAASLSENKCIKVCHMKTHITASGDVMYDRKLVEGSGPPFYGLAIAKALGFPDSFYRVAKEFKRGREEEVVLALNNSLSEATSSRDATSLKNGDSARNVTVKKSKYNPKKVLVKCEKCGYAPKKTSDMPLDTHHIRFQCEADKEGFHGSSHKDALHNLISLCKPCHQLVHKDLINIKVVQGLRGQTYCFDT